MIDPQAEHATPQPEVPLPPQTELSQAEWLAIANHLWQIIDNIDTLDDMARDHDDVFRAQTRRQQARRWTVGTTDGQRVVFFPSRGTSDAHP